MEIDTPELKAYLFELHTKTAVIREVLRSMDQCLPEKKDLKGKWMP